MAKYLGVGKRGRALMHGHQTSQSLDASATAVGPEVMRHEYVSRFKE